MKTLCGILVGTLVLLVFILISRNQPPTIGTPGSGSTTHSIGLSHHSAATSTLPKHPRNPTDEPGKYRAGKPVFNHRSPEFVKHLAIHNFLESGARDTTVARTMLKRLQENGHGIEQLGAVYDTAMRLKAMDPSVYCVTFNGQPAPEDTPELQQFRARQRGFMLLQKGFGPDWKHIDDALFAELIDMRPLVSYAPISRSIPVGKEYREPEVYLTDANLDQYLATHPIYDPPNDRGGYVTEEYRRYIENESKRARAPEDEQP